MKRLGWIFIIGLALQLIPTKSHAQLAIAEIIKAGVKKVIVALDLKVQRLQNETIWLQNAQKTIENTLSKLKLEEIGDWTNKQKQLYEDYFEELNQVKSIITYYHRVKDISQKQVHLIQTYERTWKMIRQDQHFTAQELEYMSRVYSGILAESLKNIDQILLVLQSFQTRMSDAQRLAIIRHASEQVDRNLEDLIRFNQQNILLSLARAKSSRDAQQVKQIYGLQ